MIAITMAIVATAGCSAGSNPSRVLPPVRVNPVVAHSAVPRPTTLVPAGSRLGSARELPVTGRLRIALRRAGAALNDIPARDYRGVEVDVYAIDLATRTRWVGGSLIAKHSSMRAEVSENDNGGYLIWRWSPMSGWRAWAVELTGPRGSGLPQCPAPIPASVARLWHVRHGACRSSLLR